MATLTIRMPDDKAERLKHLAASRGISVNKLIEEWANMGIAEFDARASFLARAARGTREDGLALIAEMNRREAEDQDDNSITHETDDIRSRGMDILNMLDRHGNDYAFSQASSQMVHDVPQEKFQHKDK
jgi:hypothetical protein